MEQQFRSKVFYSSIVYEISSLIKEDVIFTNEEGIIVASTDPSRIDQFHEGALIAVQQRKLMHMTEELTRKLKGVRKGVVIPIIFDEGKPIGVIGITGEPEKVAPYAMLVQKVTRLLVQDFLIQMNQERKIRELEFFIYDWLNSKEIDHSIIERGSFFRIQIKNYEQVIIMRLLNSFENLTVNELNLLKKLWGDENDTLFIRWGQNKILILTKGYIKELLRNKLETFIKKVESNLKVEVLIGVGQPTSYDRLYKSLQQAEKASSGKSNQSKIVFEDELRFDLLMNELKIETKQLFVNRTIAPIINNEVLFETLKVWFENNMSLQKTSEQLFIHKNTLQYRLRKIEELTNLKVNRLHDLVLLYVGYRFFVE